MVTQQFSTDFNYWKNKLTKEILWLRRYPESKTHQKRIEKCKSFLNLE